MRRLLVLAAAAPALVALGRSLPLLFLRRQNPPSTALEGIVGLVLLGWALVPRTRELAVAVGALLLARWRPLPLLLATLVVVGVGLSDLGGDLWLCLGAWLGVLAVAAIWHQARTEPRRLVRAGAVVLVDLALLLAMDVAVRQWILPARSHNNLFVEHDPELGWKLRPGLSLRRVNADYTSTETTSSLGFRTPDRPFDKPPGVLRVVVLGDSHTEGYVVNDDENWTVLLERALSAGRPVEVIALGVGGWSTDQELLAYLHYGRRFHPDLVLLQFCANDPPFNVLDHYWRGKKPVFERQGDELLLTGVPVPDLRNTGLLSPRLLQHSALALLAESMMRQLAIDHEVRATADPEESWRVTDLLVRDLARLVRADGARIAAFDVTQRTDPETDRRFRAVLARRDVPCLETDAAYTDDFDGYWTDGHWNAKGQQAIARVLTPQVEALLPGAGGAPAGDAAGGRR